MKKTLIFVNEDSYYYDDYTYRCPHWPEDDFSDWKVVGGDLLFKHRFTREWRSVRELGYGVRADNAISKYNAWVTSKLEDAVFGE